MATEADNNKPVVVLNDPSDKSTSNMIKHLKTPGHEKEKQLYKSGEDEKVY
jgi:hypothetical protein